MTTETQTRQFKTEVQQLLDLVIHSLYTNKDIFLRELISNASDAIDNLRFRALSDEDLMDNDTEFKIKIDVDSDNKTITVSDNGIGMDDQDIDDNIGTIASSGTQRFLDDIKKQDGTVKPELIGQFGVGFYSAFMVADQVDVYTRKAGVAPEEALHWSSDGSGDYTVVPCHKERRGTDVVLHLTEEHEEFLEEWKIRKTVTTYSDFIEYPVVMDVERPKEGVETPEGEDPEMEVKEEQLNSQKAIWAKSKEDVTEEEYKDFYKHISHDFMEPAKTIHWSVEGTTEFRALIYVPQKAPFDLFSPESRTRGVHLYVKNVYITDNCEAVIPSYLRFLRGVVDSADLPLNVSRETLQDNKIMRVINKNLVKKVIDTLEEMKNNERDTYVQVWNEFGKVLKEGVHTDFGNREKLAELLLFQSNKTETGEYVSLGEYLERMQDGQEEIYFITGDNRQAVINSPLLETFQSHNYEVLFMTDPIDEWVVQSLNAYQEHELRNIAKGDINLDEPEEEEEEAEETETEEKDERTEAYQELLAFLKDELKDDFRDVKVSKRLTDSACCLVAGEQDMGVHMERLLREMQQDVPAQKQIMEINPDHGLISKMNNLVKDTSNHIVLKEYAQLLSEQARLTAGLELKNPLQFAKSVSRLMAESSEF